MAEGLFAHLLFPEGHKAGRKGISVEYKVDVLKMESLVCSGGGLSVDGVKCGIGSYVLFC